MYVDLKPFVLNSDERSGNTVTGRIQNAIDAGSGLASGGKPTCVVIDEIDGVGGGGDQVRFARPGLIKASHR